MQEIVDEDSECKVREKNITEINVLPINLRKRIAEACKEKLEEWIGGEHFFKKKSKIHTQWIVVFQVKSL